MKLPFDLGYKLFFRLIIPGLILTSGFIPLINYYINRLPFDISIEFLTIVTIVLFGWLIIILDMPIYMLFEGRRYWPKKIFKYFLEREKLRLHFINKAIDEYYENDDPSALVINKYLEASVELRNFPIDIALGPTVKYPTKLGNTITAYETYSNSRYNISAIFYWPRIWIQLSNDVRQEIDNQQTLCDSSIYASFSAILSALLWFFYILIKKSNVKELHLFSSHLPDIDICILIVLSMLILYRITYIAAIQTNIQYGNIFMSVIDLYVNKTEDLIPKRMIKYKLNEVKSILSEALIEEDDDSDIRRYLQYYTIKTNISKRPMPFNKAKNQGTNE